MACEAELRFLCKAFEKCRIQINFLEEDGLPARTKESVLWHYLRPDDDYQALLLSRIHTCMPNTIYRLCDSLSCRYLFLLISDAPKKQVLMVGPYLSTPVNQQQLMELTEHRLFDPKQFHQFEAAYSEIPVLPDFTPFSIILDVFAESLWGDEFNYIVEDINDELSIARAVSSPEGDTVWLDESEPNIDILEKRYSYENELMHAVSHGLTHKAEQLISNFLPLFIEQRLSDPIRNIKNYCIITNTLLRKAAEQGGVHPVHLDRVSSFFAHQIEHLDTIANLQALINEMFHTYCRLVNKHATMQYSQVVQKAILQIDANLNGDISLKALANAQNLNASYLSSVFKRETGFTVTDYVNQRRVRLAIHLLASTNLQIQTIAQHCGILDVNYFSKIFKKYTQKTPKEFRGEARRVT